MPAPPADSGEQLSPIQRRQQVAAILALGVVRYCRIARLATIPRVSKLMALAIHFDRLLRSGEIADVNELAQLCHVTQPRISQILALNMLAPDIQEELLFLPEVVPGRPAIRERMLRPIAAELDWGIQRKKWRHSALLNISESRLFFKS